MVKNTFFDSRKCCPLCYSQKVKIIFSKKFDDIKTKEFFKTHLNTKFPMKILNNRFYEISECEKCHFIFQKNILNKKYNYKFYNDYIDHKDALSKDIFKWNAEIDLINRIFKNKNIRILEYGAGLGAWVKSIKNNGYKNISAVEISKIRRKYLTKFKIKSSGKLKNFNKKFDLIYSDQTFEHLTEPGKVINDLSKLLKNNGYIIFKIPSGFGFKNKLNNNYFAQKDEATPLEHINIFTKGSINYIQKKFKFINVKNYGFYKIYEKKFYKNLASFLYHQLSGKKFILQKKGNKF